MTNLWERAGTGFTPVHVSHHQFQILTGGDTGDQLGLHMTWSHLRADPHTPSTTVTIATGTPNCSQQAMAFPALRAAAHADPLAAAVDAVYFAALSFGDDHRELLAAATTQLAELSEEG